MRLSDSDLQQSPRAEIVPNNLIKLTEISQNKFTLKSTFFMGAYLGVNWLGQGRRIDQNKHNSMSVIISKKKRRDAWYKQYLKA